MKYKTALFWLGLAAVAGGVLFQTSYEAQALEERLAALNRRIVQEQEAIQVLKAEWSFLNDPVRLETLARTHLNLGPTDARQFVASLDALPARAPQAAPATVLPAAATGQVPPGYRATVQAMAPAAGQPAAATAAVVPAAARASAPVLANAAPATVRTEPARNADAPARVEPAVVKTAAPAPRPVTKPAPAAAPVRPAPAPAVVPAAAPKTLTPPAGVRPVAPAPNDSIGVMIARLGVNGQ
ncbi:cell division protein FtsL [Azospirillum halopraeferens]|uniref:cell division protein FtsL n=1 Tax=Azospirillum halopraeferens TaxID=34010 RepID=UPI0003FA47D3|nr:hypothetical protein [Azospirillum halopraeferens]